MYENFRLRRFVCAAAIFISTAAVAPAGESKVRKGWTQGQVLDFFDGKKPDAVFPDAKRHTTLWMYEIGCKGQGQSCYGTSIWFSKDVVSEVKTWRHSDKAPAQYQGDPAPGKAEAVIDVAAGIYLAWQCPKVRSKPLIWMNSYDVQMLQVCVAAGF